jgi:hypothetical protein
MPSPRSCAAAASVATNVSTETVILTVGPVNVNMPATEQGILVEATFNFTVGTGATGVTIKIRAGSGVGGAQLTSHAFTGLTAGSTYSISANALDNTFSGAGLSVASYTVTATQTGAPSAAGTAANVTLSAEACTAQW